MDIRQYLSLLRRQRWLVLATVLVVTLSAVAFYAVRSAEYQATAVVLIRGDDPTERFFTPQGVAPTTPNVDSEAAFVRSFSVVETAARAVPGTSEAELFRRISATPDRQTGLIEVHVRDKEPRRASDLTNAVARAFVEARREAALERRRGVADQLGAKLVELQRRISELDAQIGSSAPAPQPGAPAASVGPPGSPQAERYAATLQYQQVFERQQQLLIEQGLGQGGAELVAEAAPPRNPVGMGVVQGGVVAAFVGFLLAICLALLREYLDDRFRSRDEVEGEGTLPVLAEIPKDRAFRRGLRGLAAADQPLGATAEAVRGLRTRLQNLRPEDSIRTLVVTSPHPRDGKSFVAANLAAVYAQAGYRTVLVSSDLRRPALDAMLLGPAGTGTGLTSLLRAPELRPASSRTEGAGRRPFRKGAAVATAAAPPAPPERNGSSERAPATDSSGRGGAWSQLASEKLRRHLGTEAARLGGAPTATQRLHPAAVRTDGARAAAEPPAAPVPEEAAAPDAVSPEVEAITPLVKAALVPTEVANLSFLPAGHPPENPAELLGSAAMGDTLDALRSLADIVILDTPPLLAVSDAAALAARTDAVLMVTALGQTHRGALKQAMAVLATPTTKVVGTVLNKVVRGGSDAGYYAYASYAAAEEAPETPAPEASADGVRAEAGGANSST